MNITNDFDHFPDVRIPERCRCEQRANGDEGGKVDMDRSSSSFGGLQHNE
jgi:hypothetical protein